MRNVRVIVSSAISFAAGLIFAGMIASAVPTLAQTKVTPTPDPCAEKPVAAKVTAAPTPAGASSKEMAVVTYTVASSVLKDNVYVYAMLQNTTTSRRSDVKVVVTLLDEAGDVVGTGNSNIAELAYVEPGELFPVLMLIDTTGKHAKVDIAIESLSGDPRFSTPYRKFEFGKITTGRNFGWTAKGQLTNSGDKNAEFVKVVGVAYDAKGALLGVAFSYAKVDKIGPGKASPFELQWSEIKVKPARFEYYVSASEVRQ